MRYDKLLLSHKHKTAKSPHNLESGNQAGQEGATPSAPLPEMGEQVNRMPKTDVTVKLVGEDGNAFAILGKVSGALKKAGHADLAKEFMDEATAGDYDHLLRTVMEYVEVR